MGTKYLSEVLSAQEIVDNSNNKICIFSGVGSGKNWFVEHELIYYGNILYISSRRAKVNEILEEKLAQEYITWTNDFDDIVTTTNFGIEKLVMNEKFGHRFSEIIQHFSFVVVDEAHSISTDATYADSAFHLLSFLKYVNKEFPDIKIILMTGTPEPLQKFGNFIESCSIYDKREECINIVPKKISFISKKEALSLMSVLPHNQKTLYYTNSAKGIISGKKALVKQLLATGIPKKEICICMSQNSISQYQKDFPGLSDLCEETKKAITKTNTLPKDARFLLTTSTLKEGVNIKESSINVAFCESHLLSDIQQFAGRVRTALDTLYIIQDAVQHDVNHSTFQSYMLEVSFSIPNTLPTANQFLEERIKKTDSHLYKVTGYDAKDLDWFPVLDGEFSLLHYGGEAVKAFIKLIESKNQYIKFDHLRGQFDYFKTRFIEQKRVHTAISKKGWINDLETYCKKYDIAYTAPVEEKIDILAIEEYLQDHLNQNMTDTQRNELKAFFVSAFHLSSTNPQTATLNSCLESVELPFEIKSGNTNSGIMSAT